MAVLATPRRREILRVAWDEPLSAGEIHRALCWGEGSQIEPRPGGAVRIVYPSRALRLGRCTGASARS